MTDAKAAKANYIKHKAYFNEYNRLYRVHYNQPPKQYKDAVIKINKVPITLRFD